MNEILERFFQNRSTNYVRSNKHFQLFETKLLLDIKSTYNKQTELHKNLPSFLFEKKNWDIVTYNESGHIDTAIEVKQIPSFNQNKQRKNRIQEALGQVCDARAVNPNVKFAYFLIIQNNRIYTPGIIEALEKLEMYYDVVGYILIENDKILENNLNEALDELYYDSLCN